jgi:hypothetical protein
MGGINEPAGVMPSAAPIAGRWLENILALGERRGSLPFL